MYEWAVSQGIADKTHAKLITDANDAVVDPDAIFDAIKEIIDGPGVDQLIVYYAGHGVYLNGSERWLLTEAPVKSYAVVNLLGSVELARRCGIPHVVFISDACRTPPEGLQGQGISGVEIFPNESRAGDVAKPVDQFFASALGKPAFEARSSLNAGNYTAVYTEALLDALYGRRPEALERSDVAHDSSFYVKPRKLRDYLSSEVPLRITTANLSQQPEALILSEQGWLSRLDPSEVSRGSGTRSPAPPPPSLPGLTETLTRTAAAGSPASLNEQLLEVRSAPIPGAGQVAAMVDRVATPFGPDHFETECGIKVRGARIVEFLAPRVQAELGIERDVLRIWLPDSKAASVLVRFEHHVGTVIPALPGYIAALTFDDGELVDVAYEPSSNNPRWRDFARRADEVRALRAVAASASRYGRFRLDQTDAEKVAQRMQYAKGVDPGLAIYAAYAYHDLQLIDRIGHMSAFLSPDVGVTFFDLALLSRQLVDRSIGPDENFVPFIPLLSQGWALLGANRVGLHPALVGVQKTMCDSLWSLFTDAGVEQLREAIATGGVR